MLRQATLDFLRLCLWLAIIVMVFVPLERLCSLRRQSIFRKGFAVDLIYYFLNSFFPKLILILSMAIVGYALHRVVPTGFDAMVAALPAAVRFPLALLVGELGFYWGHRWSHEIPFLWRFHSVHHSAEEMDWLVNSHAHPVDVVFTRLCGFIPIYVLGLSQPTRGALDYVALLVMFTGTLWGFFIHANLRWRFGPLEWLVTTPAFHHWHHSYDEPLDRNFSSMLPLMDRIFGTWHAPNGAWPMKYGTETPVSASLAGQLLSPLIPAAGGAERNEEMKRVEA